MGQGRLKGAADCIRLVDGAEPKTREGLLEDET